MIAAIPTDEVKLKKSDIDEGVKVLIGTQTGQAARKEGYTVKKTVDALITDPSQDLRRMMCRLENAYGVINSAILYALVPHFLSSFE